MPASRIFDVRVFEGGEHLVEIACASAPTGRPRNPSLPPNSTITISGCRRRMNGSAGNRILGGRAACALVDDLVVVALRVELLLQEVGIGLAIGRP